MQRSLLLSVALVALLANAALAQGWGSLKGRIVYDGAPPKQGTITPTKDQQFCGKHQIPDETLVVNSANKGVKNVIVSLYLSRSDKAPTPHADYAKTATEPARLDNVNCRFEPHILPVRTGQPVVLGNKDTVAHNTKIDFLNNSPINPLIPPNADVTQKFSARELLPSTVSCNIHPWMTARVYVQDHPYVAVTDEDGNFELKNLPAGEWTFLVWQEKSGYVTDVKLGGKSEKWSRGRFERKIDSGKTVDLGDVMVAAAVFNK